MNICESKNEVSAITKGDKRNRHILGVRNIDLLKSMIHKKVEKCKILNDILIKVVPKSHQT